MRRIFNLAVLFLIIGVFKVLGLVIGLFAKKHPPSQHLDDTLRLYRRGPEGTEFAWFYEIDDRIYVDRGKLGEMAARRDVDIEDWPGIEAEIDALRTDGFGELDEEAWQFVQIVYEVKDGFASGDELAKRNAVTDILDEHFALTGQGFWIDSSSGMGTAEFGFLVVDYEIARESIVAKLAGTEFADYLAIRDTDTLATADDIRAEAT
ncbi:MAG: hypothetical protein HKN18_15160 [Silicimonas sp.]|nr:hypothetical protein [Silicimonas sp.]